MKEILTNVQATYEEHFGGRPLLARAPGRINLIGEHTDYNNGFVLPAAVSHSIYFAVGLSGDADRCSLVSMDFDERYDFNLSELAPLEGGAWQNYILGVAAELLKSGKKLSGFNLVFSGDVPRGSGMSSSAALECGTCTALNELFKLNIPKLDIIKIAQKAEHNYAKVMCGIMDQFASVMGKKDQALLLDCQSLEYRSFPIALKDHVLLLCNSNVSHSLASSEYNVRRAQCEEGVKVLSEAYPGIESLRDATVEHLELKKEELDEVVYRRCKYVLEENQRVMEFTEALSAADLVTAGAILKRAQHAMQYEYEISCPEIDFMAAFANNYQGVLGARMMGGGFGGCTINLMEKKVESQFVKELSAAYKEKFNKAITPIEVSIAEGAEVVRVQDPAMLRTRSL